MHTMCVHVSHTHISVSGVDSRSHWGVYPGVLSDTPTECVTQCANVPSLKQNTRHHANHALSRTCARNQMCYHLHLRVTFFQQLYHKTVRGMSSLKTSSVLCAVQIVSSPSLPSSHIPSPSSSSLSSPPSTPLFPSPTSPPSSQAILIFCLQLKYYTHSADSVWDQCRPPLPSLPSQDHQWITVVVTDDEYLWNRCVCVAVYITFKLNHTHQGWRQWYGRYSHGSTGFWGRKNGVA